MTSGFRGAWAVLGLAVLAVALPSLPVFVALVRPDGAGTVFAGVAAGLAAVMGGAKLAVALWGLRGAAVAIE